MPHSPEPGSARKRASRAEAGTRIRQARHGARLSIAEVEAALGMQPRRDGGSYLAAVEAGDIELLPRFREPLARLLGMDPADIPSARYR